MQPVCMQVASVQDSCIQDADVILHVCWCAMQAFGKESKLGAAEGFTGPTFSNCGITLIGEGGRVTARSPAAARTSPAAARSG